MDNTCFHKSITGTFIVHADKGHTNDIFTNLDILEKDILARGLYMDGDVIHIYKRIKTVQVTNKVTLNEVKNYD